MTKGSRQNRRVTSGEALAPRAGCQKPATPFGFSVVELMIFRIFGSENESVPLRPPKDRWNFDIANSQLGTGTD